MLKALCCPNCGDSNLGDDFRCLSCGSLLEAVPRDAVRCRACNQPCPPGDRFCSRCGTEVATLCPFCSDPHPASAMFCPATGGDLRLWQAWKLLQGPNPRKAEQLLLPISDLRGLERPLGDERQTLLHAAAERGLPVLVQHLIDLGADLEARTWIAETPLHLAAAVGALEVCQGLLDRGAEVDPRTRQERTPLHQAAAGGWRPVVEMLVSRGADLQATDDDQWTSLHLAALGGHGEVAAFLVDRGAALEGSRNFLSQTPLLLAVQAGHTSLVGQLLSMGADLSARDWNGRGALHLAAWYDREETATYLLRRRMSPEDRDGTGSTPLHLAAERGHLGMVRLLLEHGASRTALDHAGMNPASRADRHGMREAVNLLEARPHRR